MKAIHAAAFAASAGVVGAGINGADAPIVEPAPIVVEAPAIVAEPKPEPVVKTEVRKVYRDRIPAEVMDRWNDLYRASDSRTRSVMLGLLTPDTQGAQFAKALESTVRALEREMRFRQGQSAAETYRRLTQ